MNLTYYNTDNVSHLIDEYFSLTLSEDIVPFKTIILPIATTNITNIFYGSQKSIVNKSTSVLKGLVLSGQFFRSYELIVNTKSYSFGISFHPTAFYKILNTDISQFTNKHLPLKSIDSNLYNILNSILSTTLNPADIAKEISLAINKLPLTIDKSTKSIDSIISLIREKEGLLTIHDILNNIDYCQKTLENLFKKIVGTTPGRYIKLYRFLNLMRKYESKEIELNDLIYMYNYYDHSHFAKDFKLFMNVTTKDYFNKDYPLLKEYLKNQHYDFLH